MTDRELAEVQLRVERRLRAEGHGVINAVSLRRATDIAAEEVTKFFGEKDRGQIQWSKPTLRERARSFFQRIAERHG